MKMLMLGWELPPHNSGGLGVACYHLSKALAGYGAQIDFVLPYQAHHPGTDHMRVHAASSTAPGRASCGAYDSQQAHTSLGGIRALQQQYVQFVEQFVAQHRIDIIHAHDWLTMEAGVRAKQLTGAPLIVHVHATEFDRSGEHDGNPLVHEIEQHALLAADRILAVCALTKSIIVQRYGIPAAKVDVVYNALSSAAARGVIDTTQQVAADDTQTYQYLADLQRQGYRVVTAVTRFTTQKGLGYLLDAAKLVAKQRSQVVFLLAGDGEERAQLIEQTARLGIADRVLFTGFVRGQAWRDAYRIADIFVMSSVSEPFGLTALEAARYRTALLISRQSGVGEVLRHALRFDYWNSAELARHITELVDSPARLAALQQASTHEYESVSWDDIAHTCMELYQRMCIRRPL